MNAFAIPQAARARLTDVVEYAGHGPEAFHAASHRRLRDEAAPGDRQERHAGPDRGHRIRDRSLPAASVAPEVFRRGLLARFALDLPRTVTALDLPPAPSPSIPA